MRIADMTQYRLQNFSTYGNDHHRILRRDENGQWSPVKAGRKGARPSTWKSRAAAQRAMEELMKSDLAETREIFSKSEMDAALAHADAILAMRTALAANVLGERCQKLLADAIENLDALDTVVDDGENVDMEAA
jgi:hypothetical protein